MYPSMILRVRACDICTIWVSLLDLLGWVWGMGKEMTLTLMFRQALLASSTSIVGQLYSEAGVYAGIINFGQKGEIFISAHPKVRLAHETTSTYCKQLKTRGGNRLSLPPPPSLSCSYPSSSLSLLPLLLTLPPTPPPHPHSYPSSSPSLLSNGLVNYKIPLILFS